VQGSGLRSGVWGLGLSVRVMGEKRRVKGLEFRV
jgi:hypothetical protein